MAPARYTDLVIHATTILAVRHHDKTVVASDGQVTFGNTVMKHRARKVRRLYNDSVLAGFAGSAADAFALFSRFEAKLEQYRGNLERASVELAKDWRADRILRRLEAMLVVADRKSTFLLSGTGDLIEPDDGIVAVGSGGPFAQEATFQTADQVIHHDADHPSFVTLPIVPYPLPERGSESVFTVDERRGPGGHRDDDRRGRDWDRDEDR